MYEVRSHTCEVCAGRPVEVRLVGRTGNVGRATRDGRLLPTAARVSRLGVVIPCPHCTDPTVLRARVTVGAAPTGGGAA